MNKQIEEILKENTWASIKLKDIPEKIRFYLLKMVEVHDMIDKKSVIKIVKLMGEKDK